MANTLSSKMLLAVMITGFISIIFFATIFLIMQNSFLSPAGAGPEPTLQLSPAQNVTWNTVQNDTLGFILQYPNNFFDTGHEPQIFVGTCASRNCNAIGETIGGVLGVPPFQNQSGQKLTINNTDYLLCQSSDAATGHQYYYDYYLALKNQKCLVVTLESATATCENYLPLESGNTQQAQNYNTCITQRQNSPVILSQIINTFTFTK